jgi:hypothetical protein
VPVTARTITRLHYARLITELLKGWRGCGAFRYLRRSRDDWRADGER